jgi:hypothetical protein
MDSTKRAAEQEHKREKNAFSNNNAPEQCENCRLRSASWKSLTTAIVSCVVIHFLLLNNNNNNNNKRTRVAWLWFSPFSNQCHYTHNGKEHADWVRRGEEKKRESSVCRTVLYLGTDFSFFFFIYPCSLGSFLAAAHFTLLPPDETREASVSKVLPDSFSPRNRSDGLAHCCCCCFHAPAHYGSHLATRSQAVHEAVKVLLLSSSSQNL